MDHEDSFTPHNDLERQLLRAQDGEIPGEAFMQELLAAQVFMPVYDKHQIAGFQQSDKATPLLLQAEDGTQVLALFTSPERAKPFVKDYPGYGGGILAEFRWIVEKIGVGVGIVLNPGWPVGMEMEPDMLRQLLQQ